MAWPGQEIDNPEIGERVRFIRTAGDTDGRLLETEQWLQPGGGGGKLHVHPEQEERFTVISGALRVRTGRQTRELGPGETVAIAPGVPHMFASASSETTHFRGEVRPALRTEEFFERLAVLARTRGATPSRPLGLATLAPVLSEYRREVRGAYVPATIQRVVIGALTALSRIRRNSDLPELASGPEGRASA